jgi:TPP-dependent trihydroxycyclohexane-1,2-dione (THcHDO) dehydratase
MPWRREADVILAIGTRLQDFTTGSWTVSPRRALHLDQRRALRCHQAPALAVVGDALETVEELDAAWVGWKADAGDKEGQGLFKGLERAARQAPEAHQRPGADLCAGRGHREPVAGPMTR